MSMSMEMTNAMHANVKNFVFGAEVVVLMLVLFWYCFVFYFCEAADRSLHNNNVFVVISDIIHNKGCLPMQHFIENNGKKQINM